jgi:hypothetical protein
MEFQLKIHFQLDDAVHQLRLPESLLPETQLLVVPWQEMSSYTLMQQQTSQATQSNDDTFGDWQRFWEPVVDSLLFLAVLLKL